MGVLGVASEGGGGEALEAEEAGLRLVLAYISIGTFSANALSIFFGAGLGGGQRGATSATCRRIEFGLWTGTGLCVSP